MSTNLPFVPTQTPHGVSSIEMQTQLGRLPCAEGLIKNPAGLLPVVEFLTRYGDLSNLPVVDGFLRHHEISGTLVSTPRGLEFLVELREFTPAQGDVLEQILVALEAINDSAALKLIEDGSVRFVLTYASGKYSCSATRVGSVMLPFIGPQYDSITEFAKALA